MPPRTPHARDVAGETEPIAANPPERILFLDDDPRRAECFLGWYPHAVWVETAPQCIASLAEDWDEVHLDHDLGGEIFVDSNREDCGMEVVRWLCREVRPSLKTESRIVVHTHNMNAAGHMVNQLRAAGYTVEYIPFGMDLNRWLMEDDDDPSPPQDINRFTWSELRARVRRLSRRLGTMITSIRPAPRRNEQSKPGEESQRVARTGGE